MKINMETPLVTIGALNYNNSKFVIETLNSIAAQTYPNIELIVVDDGSSDDSLCKIKSWLNTYTKPYKLVVHEKNKGIHGAYESVIEHASGAFLSVLATDDLITPDKISDQIGAFLKLDETYGLVYGDVVDIDDNGNEISIPNFRVHESKTKDWQLPCGDVFKRVVKEFLFYIQASLIRTELIKKFKFNYKAMSEDWQVILYLARHSKFYGIDKVHTKYRRHQVSMSTQNRKKENFYLWALSNVCMFHEVYDFKENTEEDKEIIADRIRFHLFDYTYQAHSKYADVISTWRKVTRNMPARKAYSMWFFIHCLRLKLAVRKMVLNR